MTTQTKTLEITNAGFIQDLQNALFSNNLLALEVNLPEEKRLWIGIQSVQQEDGSAQGFNIEGTVMLSESYKNFSKIKGYLKYYDRSKPGTGTVAITER